MKLKILLISSVLSFPFWWGVNVLEKNLEDFLFWQKMAENPQILTAQLTAESILESLIPIRKKDIPDFELGAKSGISVLVNSQGSEKILFEKNSQRILPIASLTKLMTADIVLKNYDLSQEIKISEKAVNQEEKLGKLETGKIFSVKYLLYPLLMESSNDAAYALAEVIGLRTFIDSMNLEAKNLLLDNTHFLNPTGLDSENSNDSINYSTAKDLVKLTGYLLKEQPLIWEILSTPKFDLYGPELININKLLEEIPGIVGGKTGYTEKALGCFLLVTKAPNSNDYLINVILGSEDRFGEMKKLIDWLNQAYRW